MKTNKQYASLVFRLQSMMLLRLFFAIVFLVSAVFLFREMSGLLFVFNGVYFAVTIIYGLLLRRRFDPRLFSYLQILMDIIIVSFLILATSDAEHSPAENTFVFLYVLPIIATSLFFRLKETIIAALFISSVYILIVLGHYLAVPVEQRESPPLSLFSTLYLRTVTLCLVAFFCGHLSTLLQKKGEELSKLKNLHNLILFNMQSGVLTTDVSNTIIYANQAAEKILGASSDKMIGKNLNQFFLCRNGAGFEPMDSEAPQEDRGKLEIMGITAEGQQIPVGFNLTFINDSDEVVGKVMVFTDLTKVKELETRLRRNDRLNVIGEMAAGMAHEIRNPLASIRGSIEMLAETIQPSAQQGRLLKVLLKESDRLNNIIEYFLNETVESKPIFERRNVRDIIDEVVTLCRNSRANGAKVEFTCTTPENENDLWILGDEAQLKQVFFNLIHNAYDAMKHGGTVTIDINKDAIGDKVNVCISDTGEGIPEADLHRIFETFYTTKTKGFGIGLSIAERIVRNHNGEIQVKSKPGVGTTFTVTIPAVSSLEGENIEQVKVEQVTSSKEI